MTSPFGYPAAPFPLRKGRFLPFLAVALPALGMVSATLGGLGGDNAAYILLAQSMATGQGFRSIWHPAQPLELGYPFGFPLLLFPIVSIGGPNAFVPMHLWIVAWSWLCLFLWHRWVRRETSPGLALGSILCLAASPLWIRHCGEILSEFPYLAFSLMALLCARNAVAAEQLTGQRRWLWRMAFSLLAVYFTRNVGLVLIAWVVGWVFCTGWHLWGPRPALRRLLLLSGILLPPIGAWIARSGWMLAYSLRFLWSEDARQMQPGPLALPELGGRIAQNVRHVVGELGEAFFWPVTFLDLWAATWLGAFCLILLAVGFVRRARLRSPADGYFLCYAGLLLCLPFHEPRYLLPILPWLWLSLLEGGQILGRRAGRLLRAAFPGLVASNLAGCLFIASLNLSGWTPAVFLDFLKAHEWLKDNLPGGAVVLSRKPTVTALLTRSHAVGIPSIEDPEAFLESLLRAKVTHVLVDDLFEETRRYLLPAVRDHRNRFEAIRRFGSTIILAVVDREREER